MSKLERRYDRKEFVDNGYDLFTKFMFEVCKRAGITVYVTDNDIEDKIILTAYGYWEEGADDAAD